MTREQRKEERTARLERRLQARAQVVTTMEAKRTPPVPLTRSASVAAATRGGCGCTRSKG
jgi:hypothetical protein